METTGVCQGIGILHSDVMDTVFYSGDTWDSIGILGQVWYLIAWIPGLCTLNFYEHIIKC